MKQENWAGNNWKEGLEDVGSLPGYTLQDKHAAWEKLDARLHENKAVRKPMWYWVAAACLLIAVALVFIQSNKKDNVVVVYQGAEPVKNIVTPQPVIKENNEAKNNAIAPVKKETIANSRIKTSNDIVIKTEEQIHDSASQPPIVLPATQTAAVIIKDSIVQTATAIVPLQKKLKVVHINELDDDGSINMVQTQKHVPARIKFLNQDIYTDYTVKPAGSGLNILKLHNTPSN